jgi:hypothetical protein
MSGHGKTSKYRGKLRWGKRMLQLEKPSLSSAPVTPVLLGPSAESNSPTEEGHLQFAAGRTHRKTNFWEPTYDGHTQLTEPFAWGELCGLDRPENPNVIGKICLGTDLRQTPLTELKKVVFRTCDFFGEFSPVRRLLSIDDCTFFRCSFEDSSWTNVRFRNCKFSECAFGLVLFTRCVFDDKTRFERISVSGDFTKFIATRIVATSFLDQIISLPRCDPGPNGEGSKEAQADRLPATIRKVAYGILQSVGGAEEARVRAGAYRAYHEASWAARRKDHEISARRGRWRAALSRTGLLLFEIVERSTAAFGWATDWGTSLTRLAGIYIASIVIATGAYGQWLPKASGLTWMEIPGKLGVGLRAAVEIQLLFGYTNYSGLGPMCRAGMLAHAVFATFLYIALAAMLARESMARNPNA